MNVQYTRSLGRMNGAYSLHVSVIKSDGRHAQEPHLLTLHLSPIGRLRPLPKRTRQKPSPIKPVSKAALTNPSTNSECPA